MPRLVINPRTPQAHELQLRPGENYIGRGFANDFRLDDSSVSGSHCVIILDGASALLRDLGSTNGTFVNRTQIKEAALQIGQTFHLGGVEILYKGDTSTAPIAASSIPAHPPEMAAVLSQPIGGTLATVTPPTVQLGAMVPETTITPRPDRAQSASVTPSAPAVPAAPPLPPPMRAQPPPAPVANLPQVDIPDGKTTCKFHNRTAGQFLCQTCKNLFCSLCVGSKPVQGKTTYFCRQCGTECVPVKVNYVPPKEAELVEYSDLQVLVRSIGFAFGASMAAAAVWIGLAWAFQFEVPFLWTWGMGPLVGFAVQKACQDRPGIIFSSIAVLFTLLGIVVAKVGAYFAMGMFVLGGYWVVAALVGTCFLAWKFGGGDF